MSKGTNGMRDFKSRLSNFWEQLKSDETEQSLKDMIVKDTIIVAVAGFAVFLYAIWTGAFTHV